ncbi:sensor histidine kinase [Glycomyces terrestris]|uniref:Signal transduction histidine kinase subgroup 3 dimerisation and phosphoacceptor domain-containing protein n=1 Tax=Glycomyces terrestris TaxID=2493553 RepID=A0A426V4A9_9ACTN|nr:hypothetical protein [Glycomyces terrestris]RRS01707.1 hypothetical protein EIW28_02810 [Glycomyces terrestris]
MHAKADPDRAMRIVEVAPLLVAVGQAVGVVAVTGAYSGAPATVAAVALSALYLPPHCYLLWCAAHARRPRHRLRTLAAVSVVIAAGLPLVGETWIWALVNVIAAAAVVLSPRWAAAVCCAVAIASVPVEYALTSDPSPAWTVVVLLERTAVALVPTWFASALHRLRAAREALAADAVRRERALIDAELARTVGAWLRRATEDGPRIARLVHVDPESAAAELDRLTGGARRTIAESRRLVRGFRPVSLVGELDAALALLSAVGVHASLEVAGGELPDRGREARRLARDLHRAVDRLLQSEDAVSCRLTVARTDERLQLEVTVEGGRP